MARTCPKCLGTSIDEDAARGDAICMECGTVVEESIVVVENQYAETSGGVHRLVGTHVSAEKANPSGERDSKEITLYKGKRVIEEIASQLRITNHCIDTAYNFFKMSVTRGLTRGRIRTHVVVACLYMTCRIEDTGHLLLDFSDVTQVNVYDLGRTLSYLVRSLRINLPTTDPCLFVLRFAVLLDFGEKQRDIVTLATRLVERMKRDWIATGRRPTGLCGAALLLAARAYNFNRSVADIVRVVNISEHVVRKRLDEFAQTPSATLSIDEFSAVDLEHSEDPPSFQEARRKARDDPLLEDDVFDDNMVEQLKPIQAEVELAIEKKMREKFKKSPYASLVGGDFDDPEMQRAGTIIRNEIIDGIYNTASDENTQAPRPSTYAVTPETLGIVKREDDPNADVPYEGLPEQDGDGSLLLDGIDDHEIDSYILTSHERKMKTEIWTRLNGKDHELLLQRAKERAEAENDPTKAKKKRPPRKKRDFNENNNPAEAIEKVIQEKKLSNKVNYDILKEIERTDVPEPASLSFKEPLNIMPSTSLAPGVVPNDQMEQPSLDFALGPKFINTKLSKNEVIRRKKNAKNLPENLVNGLCFESPLKPLELSSSSVASPNKKDVSNALSIKRDAAEASLGASSEQAPDSKPVDAKPPENEDEVKPNVEDDPPAKSAPPPAKKPRFGFCRARPNVSGTIKKIS